jgi:hypothetical protein
MDAPCLDVEARESNKPKGTGRHLSATYLNESGRVTALPESHPRLQRTHPDRRRMAPQSRHKRRNLRTAVPLRIIGHFQHHAGFAKHRPPPMRTLRALCDRFAGEVAVHLRRNVRIRRTLAETQPQLCHNRVP